MKKLKLLKKEKIQTYTYDEVLSSSIKYFNGDELAATTWMNKYAMKDFNDNDMTIIAEWNKGWRPAPGRECTRTTF